MKNKFLIFVAMCTVYYPLTIWAQTSVWNNINSVSSFCGRVDKTPWGKLYEMSDSKIYIYPDNVVCADSSNCNYIFVLTCMSKGDKFGIGLNLNCVIDKEPSKCKLEFRACDYSVEKNHYNVECYVGNKSYEEKKEYRRITVDTKNNTVNIPYEFDKAPMLKFIHQEGKTIIYWADVQISSFYGKIDKIKEICINGEPGAEILFKQIK